MIRKLSPRLMRCCDYISPGARVADVGCDHGYLGIHLLSTGKASYIYAGDIHPEPLQCAVDHVRACGLENCFSFYLSDGLQAFPHDFDTLVCAGMGADTIVSVLENAPWLCTGEYRLILQCQSKTHYLRKYLSEHGWNIVNESAVHDGRFLYTVMYVIYESAPPLTPGDQYFSPALYREHTSEAFSYYQQVLYRLRRAIAGQKDIADPLMVDALTELEQNPPKEDTL